MLKASRLTLRNIEPPVHLGTECTVHLTLGVPPVTRGRMRGAMFPWRCVVQL
jgi:hypothetical protein